MMPLKRQALLIGVMLILLAMTAAWSVQGLLAQRGAARLAGEDLAVCRELAASIRTLQNKPKIASEQDIGVELLGQRISTASQQAQLNPQSLEGIYPQSPRRLGNSSYVQKPTALALRNVTLGQLVAFLYHLTEGESGLTVRDLRLRSPRSEAASNVWDAETTLTYLIYEPPATGHRQP